MADDRGRRGGEDRRPEMLTADIHGGIQQRTRRFSAHYFLVGDAVYRHHQCEDGGRYRIHVFLELSFAVGKC